MIITLELKQPAAGESAQNVIHDFGMDDVRVSEKHESDEFTQPKMRFIAPDGAVAQEWRGFIGPAEIGLEMRKTLGSLSIRKWNQKIARCSTSCKSTLSFFTGGLALSFASEYLENFFVALERGDQIRTGHFCARPFEHFACHVEAAVAGGSAGSLHGLQQRLWNHDAGNFVIQP